MIQKLTYFTILRDHVEKKLLLRMRQISYCSHVVRSLEELAAVMSMYGAPILVLSECLHVLYVCVRGLPV